MSRLDERGSERPREAPGPAGDAPPSRHRTSWLRDGAQSLLAYEGDLRGHASLAEAIADDGCRDWLEQWWAEALRHLPSRTSTRVRYTEELARRFAGSGDRHRLAGIGADGSLKLPVRVLPVLSLERAAGRIPIAATRILAGWVVHLRGGGTMPVDDVDADQLLPLASGTLRQAVTRVLDHLDPGAGADATVTATVIAHAEELSRG